MSGKLVVVSNRIPTGAPSSGGLVVALHDALTRSGGVWVGAHPDQDAGDPESLTEIASGDYDRLAFHLSEWGPPRRAVKAGGIALNAPGLCATVPRNRT